jgi:hypothetical protein
MAHQELEDLLKRIKELSTALIETGDDEQFNEETITKLGGEINNLTSIGGSIFPNLFSMSSDANPGNINLELKSNKTVDGATQTESHNHNDQFDRSLGVARIICQALKHAAADKAGLEEGDVKENFPLALELEDDKYFVGFCTHSSVGEEVVSKPKYGMMFTPNEFMSESLYIGKINDEGKEDTANGVFFQDLNFEDDNLRNHIPHAIASNDLNKFRSNYTGGFKDGKFEGTGNFVNVQPEALVIDLPFLIPHDVSDRMFSKLTVVGDFIEGQIDGEVKMEFINDEHKSKVYPIKSYDGTFEDGVFNYKGVLTFANGAVYDGEFKNGMRHGKGVYKNEKFDFDGEWEDDLMHGTFKVEFKNDSKGVVEGVKFEKGVPTGGEVDVHVSDIIEPSYLLVKDSSNYNHHYKIIEEKITKREEVNSKIDELPDSPCIDKKLLK